MAELISRTMATQILSLFDYAFKKGVVDAYETGDEFFCLDFINKRESTLTYGYLNYPYDMQWKEWKFAVGRWCEMAHGCRNLFHRHISRMIGSGYASALLPLVQDFYIMGIKEWLEYSNPLPLEIFKTQVKVHWKPIGDKTMRKMTKDEIVGLAQEFAYKRGHRSKELGDSISPSAYELFSSEIWRATRPIPKIVIHGDF